MHNNSCMGQDNTSAPRHDPCPHPCPYTTKAPALPTPGLPVTYPRPYACLHLCPCPCPPPCPPPPPKTPPSPHHPPPWPRQPQTARPQSWMSPTWPWRPCERPPAVCATAPDVQGARGQGSGVRDRDQGSGVSFRVLRFDVGGSKGQVRGQGSALQGLEL